ncbi:MAG: YraN family protein [Culturomica sp.]|jgi:putative endonuclease|nr:YraN family protein [Culturomica sp.]
MANHIRDGRTGEERAAGYLRENGYVILECNWRLNHREVDLICARGELIVVVEVKYRKQPCERPEELLDYRKRRNLLRAGAAYIGQRGWSRELRFDLIVVTGTDGQITHIPDAIRIID